MINLRLREICNSQHAAVRSILKDPSLYLMYILVSQANELIRGLDKINVMCMDWYKESDLTTIYLKSIFSQLFYETRLDFNRALVEICFNILSYVVLRPIILRIRASCNVPSDDGVHLQLFCDFSSPPNKAHAMTGFSKREKACLSSRVPNVANSREERLI